jgi:hypothetical protein
VVASERLRPELLAVARAVLAWWGRSSEQQ